MDRLLAFDSQTVMQLVVTLFNVAILFFALTRILYKPVKEFLQNRTKRIDDAISDSNKLVADAEILKEWYNEKMRAIDSDKDEILEEARRRAAQIEKSIIDEARIEAESIKARALQDIKLERENSLNEMRKQIIDISALIAGRYIEKEIDMETQNKLLDKAISDLGDATWLN